jgi:hypothetical protein
VKPDGAAQWWAKCPTHADRDPSLHIKTGDCDQIVFHCFAACTFLEVLGALGLEPTDLYPDKSSHSKGQRPRRNLGAVLRAIRFDAIFVSVAASQLAKGEPLSSDDRAKLMEAAGRIAKAVDVHV